MADRTLTINHADGDSETYTIKRDKFAGVREMSVDGSTVTVDRTAVPKEQSKETTFGGSQSITIKRDIEPLLSKVVGGASAAYSLRDLNDKAGNNKVVRVRRESDNNEKDFTAKEVSNGTLMAWVNTDVNLYTSDFSVDADGLTASNGTLAGNIDGIDGVDDTLRLTISGGDTSHSINVGSSNSGLSYTFSFDYYIPSANIALDGIDVQVTSSSYSSSIQSVTDIWTTVNLPLTPDSGGVLRFRTYDGDSRTPDGDGDVVYIKNIVFTQTIANGFVETWYDQSGNGNDATQLTAGSQPKIVDAGALVQEGGNASLEFDGVDDSLVTTQGYIVEISQNPASVFAVANPNTISEGYLLTEGDKVTPYSSSFVLNGAGITGISTVWVNGIKFGSGLPASLTLGGFIYNGTNFQAYLNGYADGASGTADINAETSIQSYIGTRADGTTDFFAGKLSEIITYKSDQSANRPAIEANINNQYDIY